MATSKHSLKKLASSIVLAQGNRFIKELLRENRVAIGATKADFHKNMMLAIDSGELRQEHFDKWLNRIEGWGDQYVYLYRIDSSRIKMNLHDSSLVRTLAKKLNLASKWNVTPSLLFPDERQLTSIICDNDGFRVTWHEGYESWQRNKEKDFDKKEGSDLFQYRAYRRLAERSVIRFEWPPADSIAALFVQLPWDAREHEQVKREVWDVVGKFMNSDAIAKLEMSEVIKNLDQRSIGPQKASALGLAAQSTKLRSGGAYVEFASTVADLNYSRAQSVRRVRRAVNIEEFEGDTGIFIAKSTGTNGLSRDIKIQLFQESDRMKVWMQCTRGEVWTLIRTIAERPE